MQSDTDYLWNTYAAVKDWISHADTKAAAVLAAIGVFSGFIVTNICPIITFVKTSYWWGIPSVLALLCLITSTLLAFRCVLPCLKVGEPTSLLYFNHIAQHKVVYYQNLVTTGLSNPTQLTSELIHQIWALSKVAQKKYYAVGRAVWGLAFALILSLIPTIGYVCSLL